jgi:hydrogenase maturation protein HypF
MVPSEAVARRISVRGVVQGVGFRPFVWRLAERHGLRGWVRNADGVVEIHLEGLPASLDAFVTELGSTAPPLAVVEDVSWAREDVHGFPVFDVDVSVSVEGAAGDRLIPPDAATCDACLRELFDPGDRRYRYPFINCTDCGPRFTIIESLPYDRARTSMRAFPMCEACRREYEAPGDRRFHAEPIACPACGPRIELRDASGGRVDGDVVELAGAMLRGGAIVAIKGLGGFHLACDATDAAAVRLLRERKRRPDKPFAVMVADLTAARGWFEPTAEEAAALTSWRAPIVLVADRGRLATGIAPGHRRCGAMLPATPLHHLLLRAVSGPLVMTSGNASDEPICVGNDEALVRLSGIADAFVLHDRAIVARYDDPVVWLRPQEERPSVARRARSFAPSSIELASPVPVPTLGVGAELHGAFCLANGTHAFLSQHIGDLDTEESMTAYRDAIARYRQVFRVEPEIVAHDLHPDFASTRFAEALGIPRVAVQHHHAHIAATMAERGLEGEVLGIAFDGLGLGDDGTIWGGEFLRCSAASSTRVGRLRPVRQPGGDVATRHPWRMAMAFADAAGVLDEVHERLRPPEAEAAVVRGQLRSGLGSPWTSSAGRLFDAVAALLGVCRNASYEGQPAVLLEQCAGPPGSPLDPVPVGMVDDLVEIDAPALFAALVADLGTPAASVAGRFHAALAEATARACAIARERTGLDRAVLGGGVFHNDLFTSELVRRLTGIGFRVFLPRDVPVGDGGIALGQVLVANAHREAV